VNPCRKITLLQPEVTQCVGTPKFRRLESVEEDLKDMGTRNWRRNLRVDNSGGQFWKRLRFNMNCNARRRRKTRITVLPEYPSV